MNKTNPLLAFVTPILPDDLFQSVKQIFNNERILINFFTFCSCLRILSNYNLKKLKEAEDSFVIISKIDIQVNLTSMSRDYRKLLNLMIEHKFLECDESYSTGNYSKGYRFGPKLLNLQWTRPDYLSFLKLHAPLTGHKLVFKRIPERFTALLSRTIYAPKTGWVKDLCEQVINSSKKLTVVFPEDFKQITEAKAAEQYAEYLKKRPNEKFPLTIDNFRDYQSNSLERIDRNEFTAKIDEEGFSPRLFTEVVNLPSYQREYLRCEEERLFNVDLRCAQFCFLAALYDDSPESAEEKEKFISIMVNQNQDIYEYFAAHMKITRDQVKEKIFTVLFCKAENPNKPRKRKGPLFRAFESLFPILYLKIQEKKKDDYKDVARLMQGIEAQIMIENVLKFLLDKDLPAFSVHDSILTTKEYTKYVEEIIKDYFIKTMGFPPVIKTKPCQISPT